MRLLIAVLMLMPMLASAQFTPADRQFDVGQIVLPGCDRLEDLKNVLSRLERAGGFVEDNDYKFLRGTGDACQRVRVRSRSSYTLHTYFSVPNSDLIFALYEVRGGQDHRDGSVVGYVANSIYTTREWYVGRRQFNECGLATAEGNCLIPRSCDVLERPRAGFLHKIKADEIAFPAWCFDIGRGPRRN